MTNVGARVFAVDSQTNVYVDAGGKVIQLSSAGVPLQTNVLSSDPGMPHRDVEGFYYYAGKHSVGFSPGGGYNYTNPACFLAKYTAAGSLVWSNDFGPTGFLRTINIRDLKRDSEGNCLVAFTYNVSTIDHSDVAVKVGPSGSILWSSGLPKSYGSGYTLGSARLGPISPTNAYVVTFTGFSQSLATLSRLDANGGATVLTNWTVANGGAWLTERPIGNSVGEFFEVEGNLLVKRNASADMLWSRSVPGTRWTLGEDQFDGVHTGDDSGDLSRYDFDGNPVWSTNLVSVCNGMVTDVTGNRFVSLLSGVVARLGPEALSGPFIITPPLPQTVLVGSNLLLSVTTTGSGPLRYFWQFNGSFLPGKTNSTLGLTNVTLGQAGLYSVTVSNFLDSVTSAPALLRVKSVAIFADDQLLTNGTYTFATPPTLSIRSTFAGGSTFYSLDGSAPTFRSIPYSGPFSLAQSATIRAIAYSADFLQSEEADAVLANVLVTHQLTVIPSDGGSVSLNPPGGTYVSTNIVAATAVASNGWSFLYWLGDASGNNATVNLAMNQDRTIQPIFATTLSTTVAGNGQVLLNTAAGPYPYGSRVRLTGVPQPGSYFGFWGNAATGNTNPLYFAILNPTQTVSSIFGTLPAGQVALTVLIAGGGRVTVTPRDNAYTLNQTVTLTATPDSGQGFLSWTGDASGTQNPLSISMNQSRVITANFSSHPILWVSRPGVEGLTPEGFRLTLLAEPQQAWQILASTNLVNWDLAGTVTNTSGAVQFTDPSAPQARRFYKAVLAP